MKVSSCLSNMRFLSLAVDFLSTDAYLFVTWGLCFCQGVFTLVGSLQGSAFQVH